MSEKNDDILLCPICKDEIGFIDMELGVFDPRYFKQLEKHTCKEWHDLNGGKK